jgi:hypothetical protein
MTRYVDLDNLDEIIRAAENDAVSTHEISPSE